MQLWTHIYRQSNCCATHRTCATTPQRNGWMLTEAGFRAEVRYTWTLRLQFEEWTQRMATPPAAVAMLRTLLTHAPAEVRAQLQVEVDCSFTLQGALIEGASG